MSHKKTATPCSSRHQKFLLSFLCYRKVLAHSSVVFHHRLKNWAMAEEFLDFVLSHETISQRLLQLLHHQL
jgi:hypothetical protein